MNGVKKDVTVATIRMVRGVLEGVSATITCNEKLWEICPRDRRRRFGGAACIYKTDAFESGRPADVDVEDALSPKNMHRLPARHRR
ncbi:MAG: hypothetical protein Kow0074_22000 [Candidatus Zixiibacteriota bacterium]